MSKDSNPLMFIETVSEINSTKEIKEKKVDKVYMNRMEDIKAMLYYKIDILCEIKTKNTLYEGVVKNVNDLNLELLVDKKIEIIPINQIEDINILKL